LGAAVTPRKNACGDRMRWKGAALAKLTRLIPARDRIEMTHACVAMIRRHPRGVADDIVRLDNGAASENAEKFIENQEKFPDAQVLWIVEPFKDARISNLGAKLSAREFLFFLDNDMIVSQSSWPRLMMAESHGDEKVGAAGCKLLQSNQTVRHVAAVLGVDGVADRHAPMV
jgi:O-antigen biosynthesis protein